MTGMYKYQLYYKIKINAFSVSVTCVVWIKAHLLVIYSEVIVELDNAFSLFLELSVGLLSPPLFEVAVAIILAP